MPLPAIYRTVCGDAGAGTAIWSVCGRPLGPVGWQFAASAAKSRTATPVGGRWRELAPADGLICSGAPMAAGLDSIGLDGNGLGCLPTVLREAVLGE